ncbi:MAG: hypothetical protein LDL10_04555 [Calditerrivibrio sp.]|nr:hypothetical protein [Calditerrivibrio sp.]
MKLHVQKAKPLITYYEIVAITAVFIFILYILYPGDKIRELALRETKNIELTTIYLRQIIKIYPNELENWDRLLSMYIKLSDTKSAYSLINEMEMSNSDDIRSRSAYLKYSLLKQFYFQTKDPKYRDELEALSGRLILIFNNDTDKLKALYSDYLSFGMPHISKEYARSLYLYYRDKNSAEFKTWLLEYYKQSLAVNDLKSIKESLILLVTIFPDNIKLRMDLAEIYISYGELDNAITLYKEILGRLPYAEKKNYVMKISQLYQLKGDKDSAADILRDYEMLFDSYADKKLLIRLYLGLNRLDYAKDYAKKVIE